MIIRNESFVSLELLVTVCCMLLPLSYASQLSVLTPQAS